MSKSSIEHFILQSAHILFQWWKENTELASTVLSMYKRIWSNHLLALTNVKHRLIFPLHGGLYIYLKGFFPMTSWYFKNIDRKWKYHDKTRQNCGKHGEISGKIYRNIFRQVINLILYSLLFLLFKIKLFSATCSSKYPENPQIEKKKILTFSKDDNFPRMIFVTMNETYLEQA